MLLRGTSLALLCQFASPTSPAPCDLLAASGAPCVAAHAVSRALFAAYGAPLFQLLRTRDRAVRDVGVLGVGGFVNASAVDEFCDASCVISVIYDQSGRNNHLSINASGDRGVNATRHRTSAGGVPVFAAYFERIMGYRSDLANGTAVGNEAELVYMVTSGAAREGSPPPFNDECCFGASASGCLLTLCARFSQPQLPRPHPPPFANFPLCRLWKLRGAPGPLSARPNGNHKFFKHQQPWVVAGRWRGAVASRRP